MLIVVSAITGVVGEACFLFVAPSIVPAGLLPAAPSIVARARRSRRHLVAPSIVARARRSRRHLVAPSM